MYPILILFPLQHNALKQVLVLQRYRTHGHLEGFSEIAIGKELHVVSLGKQFQNGLGRAVRIVLGKANDLNSFFGVLGT